MRRPIKFGLILVNIPIVRRLLRPTYSMRAAYIFVG
jgi:hypothetical protein